MWWKRIKKKQIEAGILLYALFMSAVFSLLLQFYLNRQVAERRILLASQHRIQAYAQAQLAIDTWDREEKTITFSTGRVDLEEKSGFANVTSHLQDGGSYHFTFALPPREKKKTRASRLARRPRKRSIKTPIVSNTLPNKTYWGKILISRVAPF